MTMTTYVDRALRNRLDNLDSFDISSANDILKGPCAKCEEFGNAHRPIVLAVARNPTKGSIPFHQNCWNLIACSYYGSLSCKPIQSPTSMTLRFMRLFHEESRADGTSRDCSLKCAIKISCLALILIGAGLVIVKRLS